MVRYVLLLFLTQTFIPSHTWAQKTTFTIDDHFIAARFPEYIRVYIVPSDINQVVFYGLQPELNGLRIVDCVLYIDVKKNNGEGHIVLIYDRTKIDAEFRECSDKTPLPIKA